MTRLMPRRPEKLDFFLALANTGTAADDDLGERRAQQERRRQGLDYAKPCITAEDTRAIIRGELKPTTALRTTQSWIESVVRPAPGAPPPPAFLVLVGDQGRGKTVACAWVAANELCRFVTGPELTQLHVQEKYGDRRASEALLQVRAAGLLILDDLCRENHPPREEADAMFNLAHARQKQGYHTLVTTNHGLDVLRDRLGVFVSERLTNAGLIVKLVGDNLRRVG